MWLEGVHLLDTQGMGGLLDVALLYGFLFVYVPACLKIKIKSEAKATYTNNLGFHGIICCATCCTAALNGCPLWVALIELHPLGDLFEGCSVWAVLSRQHFMGTTASGVPSLGNPYEGCLFCAGLLCGTLCPSGWVALCGSFSVALSGYPSLCLPV